MLGSHDIFIGVNALDLPDIPIAALNTSLPSSNWHARNSSRRSR